MFNVALQLFLNAPTQGLKKEQAHTHLSPETPRHTKPTNQHTSFVSQSLFPARYVELELFSAPAVQIQLANQQQRIQYLQPGAEG